MKSKISITSALLCVLIGVVIGYMIKNHNKNKECGVDSCPRSCGNCPYCRRKSPSTTLEIPKPQLSAVVVKQETPLKEIKGYKEGIRPPAASTNPYARIYQKGMQKINKTK